MKWRRAHWPRMRRRLRWPRLSSLRRLRPRTRGQAATVALVLLLLLWLSSGSSTAAAHWPRPQILDAIRFVESSDRDDVADGDEGRAIGPYQIHRVYWQDALRAQPALGGSYEQCRQRAYAERVIDAYMQYYVPRAWSEGDAETIARVHNGGPKGRDNPKTDRYWKRVRERLPR